jgi:hypothetical protein
MSIGKNVVKTSFATRVIHAKKFIVLLVFGLMVQAGCEKRVVVTFVNQTDAKREVTLRGSGQGVGYVGALTPKGKIRTEIVLQDVDLPSHYVWYAGDLEGGFTISSGSDDARWVNVGTPAPKE